MSKAENNSKAPEKQKNKKDKVPELSEEDQALKDNITNWVEDTKNHDPKLQEDAVYKIFHEVISATSSMTSLPKPMKFLGPHYNTLVEQYNKTADGKAKQSFADLLSLLSGTLAEPYEQEVYKYLKEGSGGDFLLWGHEYQLQLAGDISKIYDQRLETTEDISVRTGLNQDLVELTKKLVKYFMRSNCEIDAVDLLLEIDHLNMIEEFIDKDNIRKIYDYLLASSPFTADQEEYKEVLRKAYHFCLKVDEHFLALRAAFKLDDAKLVEGAFNSCKDPLVKKQLALSLGRQRYLVQPSDEDLVSAMCNSRVSEFFLKLMKDLDIEKPKHPETDIYKSKNESYAQIESSQYNLAMTYTNAFVNLGSGKDTLMSAKTAWLPHLSKEGQFAATAGEGLVRLWDVDESCEKLGPYIELVDSWAKAGACLGCGISNSGVWSDVDPARAILGEAIEAKDSFMKLGASIGFGIAYAGTAREDLRDSLIGIITDLGVGPDTAGFAAASLGLIFVSKSDDETINTILTTLMERPPSELDQVSSRLFAIGLALTCLGQQEKAEAVIETLKVLEHPIGRYAEVAVEAASYVGSGNVLKIQDFMKRLLVHEEEGKTLPQAAAVVGLAFIAGSEKVGQEMASRLLNHILQYCDLPVKRAVPIALAILNISNPTIQATDLLSKLAHDEDKELSLRAIFAMGLIGLGTNNARIAGLLKDLSFYYSKDPNHDYMTKITQGLLSAGKGLVTANPVFSDQFLYSKAGMGALFLIANLMLDTEINLVTKFHYSLYYLVPAIYPRWLFTLDENMENFPISVRVGQAVDTVAQVGNPRTITGFQTHQSPIVFSAGDRAEVATEEYIPVTKNLILENFVIVKKNPDFEKDKELNPRKKTSASIYF